MSLMGFRVWGSFILNVHNVKKVADCAATFECKLERHR